VLGLKQRTKQAVIAELVGRLIDAGRVEAANEAPLVQLIMAREEMGSTAMGNGIAMPHCRTSLTERFMGVVAIDANGVDFGALDRQLVHLVFLLLAPLDQRERLFDILGRISSLRQEKTIRTQLRGCRSREDVTSILKEMDGSHG
jgi:mannitol/fructose-specific phosphotransferase system IIA component (Ntr-type)